jgi:hypothetical protein
MMTSEIVVADTTVDNTILSFPWWMPVQLRVDLKQYLACKRSLVLLKEQQSSSEGGLGYFEFLQQRIDQAQSFISLMENQYAKS